MNVLRLLQALGLVGILSFIAMPLWAAEEFYTLGGLTLQPLNDQQLSVIEGGQAEHFEGTSFGGVTFKTVITPTGNILSHGTLQPSENPPTTGEGATIRGGTVMCGVCGPTLVELERHAVLTPSGNLSSTLQLHP